MGRTRKMVPLSLAVVAALAAMALSAAPAQAASESLGVWTSNGAGGWSFQNVTAAVGGTSISGQAKPIIDGHGIIHVYASSPSGDLLEFIQGQPGQWTVTDLSSLVGGATIATDPTPLLLAGSAGVDVQVFALNSAGHLLSFVEGNSNPGVWQVFDLTALSGSTATLAGDVGAIQVGNDLHIYAIGNAALHDFVKAPTSNWMDVNLSAITGQQVTGVATSNVGVTSACPVPFAYGGNSIQITALDGVHASDMDVFVEGVQPDGSLTGSFSDYDIGQLMRGPNNLNPYISVASSGSPLLFGPANGIVGIYTNNGAGTVSELFKTSGGPWLGRGVGQAAVPDSGVAALLAGGRIDIFAIDTADQLQLFTTPITNDPGPFANVDVTTASGAAITSVPNALFVPQTGQTMVFGGH